VSPKRGDRVTVPPPADEWDVRFASKRRTSAIRDRRRTAPRLARVRVTAPSERHGPL